MYCENFMLTFCQVVEDEQNLVPFMKCQSRWMASSSLDMGQKKRPNGWFIKRARAAM